MGCIYFGTVLKHWIHLKLDKGENLADGPKYKKIDDDSQGLTLEKLHG